MKRYELSFRKNIRDLGGLVGFEGLTIKYGRLYRGDALSHLSKEDILVVSSFHLTDVVDFRGQEEFHNRPDVSFPGVRYSNLPIIDEKVKRENKDDGNLLWFVGDHTSGYEHLKKCYRDFVLSPKSIASYRAFFSLLLEKDRTFYFHCSQGKDRAGFAAYLLEIALGVSCEDAIADYLLSNIAMEKRVEALLSQVENKDFYNESYRRDLIDVFSAKEDYLNESITKMDELYGGTMGFLEKALLVDIDALRRLYLE